jgi:hypothetical protein
LVGKILCKTADSRGRNGDEGKEQSSNSAQKSGGEYLNTKIPQVPKLSDTASNNYHLEHWNLDNGDCSDYLRIHSLKLLYLLLVIGLLNTIISMPEIIIRQTQCISKEMINKQ